MPSPANEAATAISRVWSSPARATRRWPRAVAGEHGGAAGGGLHAGGVEAGAGEEADRVDGAGMAGEAGRLGVGDEDRRLALTRWRGRAMPTTRDRVRAVGGRDGDVRAELGRVAGDDLAGARGRAAGGQRVRRERGAATSRAPRRCGLRAWAGTETSAIAARTPGTAASLGGERGAHAGALGERDVVVGADACCAGDDGGRGGVALDGRMRAECGLEQHAAGHREDGGGEEGQEGADEGAEAACGR